MNDFAGQSEVLAGQLRENIAFEKTGITKERKFRLVESLAFGYPHAHQLQRTNEISRLKRRYFAGVTSGTNSVLTVIAAKASSSTFFTWSWPLS